MQPILLRLAAATSLVVAAITTACSGDSSTSPAPQPTGAYPMSTARCMTVPHTFTDAAGSKLTIEGGGMTLSSNGV
jgi:hypothetical protein